MLIRTQVLLEEEQKQVLEELAASREVSLSEMVRRSVPLLIKMEAGKMPKKKKITEVEALMTWTKGAIHGPGDSEYDKYTYDN